MKFKKESIRKYAFVFAIVVVATVFFLMLNIQQYMTNQTYDLMDEQIFNLSNNIKFRMMEIEDEMIFSNSVGVFDGHINYEIDSPNNRIMRRFLSKFEAEIGKITIYNEDIVKVYEMKSNGYFDVYKFDNNIYKMRYENDYSEDDNLILAVYDENNNLESNVRLKINVKNIIEQEISKFYINGEYWIWYINKDSNIEPLYYSDGDLIKNRFKLEIEDNIIERVNNGLKGKHENFIEYDKRLNTLTSYYPIKFREDIYGIGFSVSKESIIRSLTSRIIALIITFSSLLFLIILYYAYILKNEKVITKELQEARDSIITIIENVPFAIFIYNYDYDILDANEGFTKLFGFDDKEMIGKKIYDFLPIEKLKETESIATININGKIMTIIYKIIPVKFKNRNVKLFTFTDVTEIEEARKLAEKSNKVKSEFIANVSHEIRTPMNGIIASIDILKEMKLDNNVKEYVEVIEKSSRSLLDLINNILDFSKIESGKVNLNNISFNIYEVTKNISIQFKGLVQKKNLDFEFVIDDDIPRYLFGDFLKLEQILINLIGNAIKFTQEGKILFKVKKIKETKERVYLEFVVADTGIGIPKEKIDKIFEVFVQVDSTDSRMYEGTGLGTTISKKLVNLLGGRIIVESPHDEMNGYKRGTCFKTYIPFKIEKDNTLNLKKIEEIDVKKYNEKFKNLKVLLVEDNKINAKVALKILTDLDLNVTLAENGKEAINIFMEEKFDIVFMDIQMPMMSGIEATEVIKEIDDKVPIVALTAAKADDLKSQALNNGMEYFISKPITKKKILNTINKIKG